jgi:hypothetical protein
MKKYEIVLMCVLIIVVIGAIDFAHRIMILEDKVMKEQYEYATFISNIQHLPLPTFEQWETSK